MGKILIDTDDLQAAGKQIQADGKALGDTFADLLNVKSELEGMRAAGTLPAATPEQDAAMNKFFAALPKIGEGLDKMGGGLGKYAQQVFTFDTSGGMGTAKSAAGVVLGAAGAKNIPIVNGQPIAEGSGKVSGFLGYETSGHGKTTVGGLTLEGGYVLRIGAGYEADGSYRVDEHGVAVRGHAETQAGIYAEAYGSIDYGFVHAGGKTSSMTGTAASADGVGNLGWGDDGPQADVGLGGRAFAGEEWNAAASADFGFGSANAGAGFKAGVGAQFSLDAHFGADRIGFNVDIGASLGIGLEINFGIDINPGAIVGGAFDFGKDLITDPFGTIGDLGGDLVGGIGDIGSTFGDIGEGIGKGFADVGSSIVSGAGDIIDGIGDLF